MEMKYQMQAEERNRQSTIKLFKPIPELVATYE